MKSIRSGAAAIVTLFVLAGAVPMGCPVWRTEHKVETTHKIDAHIVLDVRKVQEEAAEVESDVRGGTESRPQSTLRFADTQSRMVATRSIWSIFDLSTSAAAQNPDDEKDAIARRKSRFNAVDSALSKGCLGESNKGYLEARPCDASGDKQGRLRDLIRDENSDRKIIYAAIAVRQGVPASQADAIGKAYAPVNFKALKKGQPFQIPSEDALYGEFLNSDLGRKLGGRPNKGEWVKAP